LAKANVSWKLGNGEDIQFWSDSWLLQGPLINNLVYEDSVQECTRQFGFKVRNYRNGQEWRDLSLISEDLKPIMIVLNYLVLNNKKDELVWKDNPNGSYYVASGYKSL
jgi:hypothetical protein